MARKILYLLTYLLTYLFTYLLAFINMQPILNFEVIIGRPCMYMLFNIKFPLSDKHNCSCSRFNTNTLLGFKGCKILCFDFGGVG